MTLSRTTPLKRTPFANRGKPLARGNGLPRCRKTTRKDCDKAFRKQYRADNPKDEWLRYLNFVPPIRVSPDDPRLSMPDELNHIFTAPRRDLLPVVIRLSKANHDWFHTHLQVGRLLCLLAKCRKGEHDLPTWDRCFGSNSKPKSVFGWLQHLHVAPMFRAYRDELLCFLSADSRGEQR